MSRLKGRTTAAGLYHTILGRRPLAMLVMHGGLGPDHSYLRPWLDPLQSSMQLIYYDHRGGGRSARVGSHETFTAETLVRDADDLREALGLERIVVFGHSFGGMLAMVYALRYPARVLGLILCCTAPAWDYAESRRLRAAAHGDEMLRLFNRYSTTRARDDDTFRRMWLDLQPLYFRRPRSDIVNEWARRIGFSAHAFNLSEDILAGFDVVASLHGIAAPTLIIAGRHDWATPVDQADRIRSAMPHAEMVTFEESGHYPFIEEQEQFIASVTSWVGRLPATSSARDATPIE